MQADSIARQAKLAGEEVPDEIVNRPTLAVGLQFYLTAFQDLGTCRSVGMSPGPIPWTAKAEYAKFYGLSPFEAEQLFSILDRLDFDYLSSVKPAGGKNNGGLKRPSK